LTKWRNDKSTSGNDKKGNKKTKKPYKSSNKKEFVQQYMDSSNWMKTKPNNGKNTKKENDAEYHWCIHHSCGRSTSRKIAASVQRARVVTTTTSIRRRMTKKTQDLLQDSRNEETTYLV
jgi:hypothetical protein